MSNIDFSGKQIDKYQILCKLGAGAFGDVYRAYDIVLQSEVALKVIRVVNPQALAKCFDEAAIQHKCEHLNIVKIIDAGVKFYQNIPLFVIVMDLVDGGTVEGLLNKQFCPVIDTVRLSSLILNGLEFAHIKGIIHCDIKPGNILLDKNGIPKLSDFGLAFMITSLSQAGGTPNFYYRSHGAPEIRQGTGNFSVQTDIYAMGMTMYRMLNNIRDWTGFLRRISESEHLLDNGKFVSTVGFSHYVPEQVRRIVCKACHPNQQHRYQNAADMRNALQRLQLLYNWQPIDATGDHWLANDALGKRIEAFIENQSGSGFAFSVKKNNRVQRNKGKIFERYDEAHDYLVNFVKENTFA